MKKNELIRRGTAWLAVACATFMLTLPARMALAQHPAGVPVSELAPGSPERYLVKPGDTLRSLAGMFLQAPWRWGQLWAGPIGSGEAHANPPLIYPGQLLVLERQADRATLRVERVAAGSDSLPTLRLSPRLRVQLLPEPALAALEPHLIEPFLAEPLVVDEDTFKQAPRVVAAPEGRVLITRGDHAYARGPAGSRLEAEPGAAFRVFREARALRDPVSDAVLGHEARYLGRALLLRPQGHRDAAPSAAGAGLLPVPAILEIVSAREEIRAGDRLLPEPPRTFRSYVPRAPQAAFEGGRVASMYGDAVGMAGQNQVVVINKGSADGLADGHVLALVKSGPPVVDRTTPGLPESIQLPDERNGLLMVFRTFDKLSYALILSTADGVKIGDRVIHPD